MPGETLTSVSCTGGKQYAHCIDSCVGPRRPVLRNSNYCLLTPQPLYAVPHQQPVRKHSWCIRTHTVDPQSGRPPLWTHITLHLPNALVQLKPGDICRFGATSGSRRLGSIAAMVASLELRRSAFERLVSLEPWRGFSFSSTVPPPDELGMVFGVEMTVGESLDQSERQGRGVSIRMPAPFEPSSLRAIL
jgi:hypothetical protein